MHTQRKYSYRMFGYNIHFDMHIHSKRDLLIHEIKYNHLNYLEHEIHIESW